METCQGQPQNLHLESVGPAVRALLHDPSVTSMSSPGVIVRPGTMPIMAGILRGLGKDNSAIAMLDVLTHVSADRLPGSGAEAVRTVEKIRGGFSEIDGLMTRDKDLLRLGHEVRWACEKFVLGGWRHDGVIQDDPSGFETSWTAFGQTHDMARTALLARPGVSQPGSPA